VTPLLVAPSSEKDLLGKMIASSVLIRKLSGLNKAIFCPDANDRGHIEGWHGVTSLWLGEPGGGGRPICGVRLGQIPEWTQVDGNGMLITKGWRAIFDKVIKTGAVRREDVERAFAVALGEGKRDAGLCVKCLREGRRAASNGGAAGMCDTHDGVYSAVKRAKESGPEREERAAWTKEKIIVS
jgi:hypothetical protein